MTQHLVRADPLRGRDRLAGVVDPGAMSIDEGVTVTSPATDTETADLLRVAGEEGWRVLPRGAGIGPWAFHVDDAHDERFPRTIEAPDLIISSKDMTEIVIHEPGNLTVCVRAGVTLGAIQSAVSAERQWLALDPPGGSEITLGGVVATGVAGPLRAQYGRPRDHILGLTLVDGKGRVLSLGGGVVKNVAGFDLVRLAAGSSGALGMITQITLRLHPRPEEDRTLIWRRGGLVSAWELGRDLATLPIPLAAAELLAGGWPSPLGGGGVRILLRLTGSERAVQRMVDIVTETGGAPDDDLTGELSMAATRAVSEGDGAGPVSFRLHSLPSRSGDILSSLQEIPFERLGLHLLGGTFRGTLPGGMEVTRLFPLAETVREVGGTFSMTRGRDNSTATGIEVRQPTSLPKARLRSDIVRGFDPSGILPGAWREDWLGSGADQA